MKKSILILAIVSFLTFSCSKDDDSSTPEPTTEALLVSGKWYLEALGTFTLTPCDKQSYFLFADSTSLIVELFGENGATAICEQTGLSSYSYSINSSNQIVTVRNGEISILTIEAISSTNLQLSREVSGESLQYTFRK